MTTFFDPAQLLVCKDGSTVLASQALIDAEYVLVYFAASWCGPCCEFASLLRTFYERHHVEKAFEVVLLSFDNSEAAMMDYFVHYHGNYFCLPYADAKATRVAWMEHFNVKGLPSLVVFQNGAAQAVVTHYGCNMVVADPEGVSFPWPETGPMLLEASQVEKNDSSTSDHQNVAVNFPLNFDAVEEPTFFDDPSQKLLRQDGSTVLATEALKEADYVLVYCSAHWCSHCVKFTPLLKKFYEEHHKEKKFEIVFLSFDFSEEEMLDYFKEAHGNYYCLQYDDAQKIKPTWMNLYDVQFIPTLLVFENGYPRVLVTHTGRERVEGDPDAAAFPWKDTAGAVVVSADARSQRCSAVPRPLITATRFRIFLAIIYLLLFLHYFGRIFG